MKPTRAAAYVLGGMLLAAWLASAAGVGHSQGPPPLPSRSPESLQLDALASGVQSQALRLHQRLALAPAPRAAVRNPFEFGAVHPAETVSEKKPIAAVPTAGQMPPEPNLVLIGLAEDGTTRTAVIQSGDDLVMATEGQTVVNRYRVTKVSPDAIELTDLLTGTTRRLFLRSQASPL